MPGFKPCLGSNLQNVSAIQPNTITAFHTLQSDRIGHSEKYFYPFPIAIYEQFSPRFSLYPRIHPSSTEGNGDITRFLLHTTNELNGLHHSFINALCSSHNDGSGERQHWPLKATVFESTKLQFGEYEFDSNTQRNQRAAIENPGWGLTCQDRHQGQL